VPSVDGLISGLKTTDIVSQLMRLEKQPQVRLQTRQATVQERVGSLRAQHQRSFLRRDERPLLPPSSPTLGMGAATAELQRQHEGA
jgi:hypothetical protein